MTKKMMKDGNQYKKGLWTEEEDRMLIDYVRIHGKGHWNRAANKTGLKRGGKSCRLRWMNYLSPNVKRDRFSEQEEDLIIRLHNLLGNRWSLIAKRVPGRTDNQVKNYWNTHLSKKLSIHHEQSTGIGVSSPTKSREIAASETVENSDNSTLSGNANLRNDFLVDIEMQKTSDQEAPVTEELVMKDDDMNPLWIIDDAIEMSELLMELDWYSFDLA